MELTFDTHSMRDYETFLRLKRTPAYRWRGHTAIVPDEYAGYVTGEADRSRVAIDYQPSAFCFDYQRDIAALAIRKRKFAVFAECGLGKTIIQLEYARHILRTEPRGKVLFVAPLMVVRQTADEASRFYGDTMQFEVVPAAGLQDWLNDATGSRLGITNYESIREGLTPGNLIALVLDESSTLKSHYGAWGTRLIELGAGLEWKMACTGTPAPNDRIEFANHAVFLDHFRTTHEFLANYFINRGQTQNRWEIKAHALPCFYRDLSHWCIFLSDPAVYGWKDNVTGIPPIHMHIETVPLTPEQRAACQELTGSLMVTEAGGIGSRGALMQIAKGEYKGAAIPTNKPAFIRKLVDSWPTESTILWCHYNAEQDAMERTFPEAGSIQGKTPLEERRRIIDAFKAGRARVLISKPEVLGFGLNLQVATRHVFNGLTDSYEDFWQAIKRSNRIGSTRPLNVHIPATEIEEAMISNVLQKADRVESDTRVEERLFHDNARAQFLGGAA